MKKIILLITFLAKNVGLESKFIKKMDYLVPDCNGVLWKSIIKIYQNECNDE